MYKAEAAASLPPPPAWVVEALQKFAIETSPLSLSLSLKWVALPREAIDYFEEEEEMPTRFSGFCSVPYF